MKQENKYFVTTVQHEINGNSIQIFQLKDKTKSHSMALISNSFFTNLVHITL